MTGGQRWDRSPFFVGNAVEALAVAEGVDVEDVFAGARGIRRAVVAAAAPGALGRRCDIAVQGIARDAAEEIDLRAGGALRIGDAFDEGGKGRWIARLVRRTKDAAFVGGPFVRIERIADLLQGAAQLGFLPRWMAISESGSAIEASVATIAAVMRTSIRVKPRCIMISASG